jgi:hypothetical protein
MTLDEFCVERDIEVARLEPKDAYDAAIIGVALDLEAPKVVYDWDLLVQIMVDRDGVSHEEAEEWFDYNLPPDLVVTLKRLT